MKQINPNLTDHQKEVLFKGATEAPGTGELLHNDKTGMYTCANCGAELFTSDSKYTTTTPGLVGWPSFSEMSKKGTVTLQDDTSLGMVRQEAVCTNCGVHLGHLFDDEESPSGVHFCINSASLDFSEKK